MSTLNRHQLFKRFELDSHGVIRIIPEESVGSTQRSVGPEVCEILINSPSSQQIFEKRFHKNCEMNTSAISMNWQFFKSPFTVFQMRDLCFNNILVMTSIQTAHNTFSPAINMLTSSFISRICTYKSLSQNSFDSLLLDLLSLSNALDLPRTLDIQNGFVMMLAIQYNRTCVWLERFYFHAFSEFIYPLWLCFRPKRRPPIWINKSSNGLSVHK